MRVAKSAFIAFVVIVFGFFSKQQIEVRGDDQVPGGSPMLPVKHLRIQIGRKNQDVRHLFAQIFRL